MTYKVIEIDNKRWDTFVLVQSDTLFVQSSSYAEFYRKQGEQAWLFGVVDESNILVFGSLVASTHAKRGNFLYLPYGPIGSNSDVELYNIFFSFLTEFGKKQGYHFVRFSPFFDETGEYEQLLKSIGAKPSPMHILAETTWLLPLKETEEKLLANMNKNHRNLINRCQRDGVRVEMRTDLEALKLFNDLHDETAKRHKFHRFSRAYIEHEFCSLVEQGNAVIFLGYLPDGTLDAASIIIYFGNTASYRHAASLNQDKRLPTAYLLQWKSIVEAKKRGMTLYNFWGIAPETASKDHPFYGITHYKKGFGGYQRDIVHCHDIVLSSRYYLTWIVETIRSKKRGFS